MPSPDAYLVILLYPFDGFDGVRRLDERASAARRLARQARRLRARAARKAHRTGPG